MNKINNKQKFLNYIANDYPDDLWADVEIIHAIHLANNLSVNDWSNIYAELNTYENNVQERIADVICDISNWNIYLGQILLELLRSHDNFLIQASIDTLNSISQKNLKSIDFLELRKELENLSAAKGLFSIVLDSLKKKIG